jgi:hypothetical protein
MKYVLWAVLILSLLAGCVLFTTGTNTVKVPVYLTDNELKYILEEVKP